MADTPKYTLSNGGSYILRDGKVTVLQIWTKDTQEVNAMLAEANSSEMIECQNANLGATAAALAVYREGDTAERAENNQESE